MKSREIFLLSVLLAMALAYAVDRLCEALQLTLNLEEILKNTNPRTAGVVLAKSDWKTLLLDKLSDLVIFLLTFATTLKPTHTLLAQFIPALFPATGPFSKLTALISCREDEFTAMSFVGREAEIDKLNEFLGEAQPLRWQVLNGEPGVGKTRLAYEWARGLKGWSVKVLNPKPELETFKPWRKTVVVVDDYATRKDDIDTLLKALPKKHKPIRLLLIDWATPGWLDELPIQAQANPAITCADFDANRFAQILPDLWPKDRPAPDATSLFEQCDGNLLALERLLSQPSRPKASGRRQVFRRWAGQVRQNLIAKGLPDDYLPLVALACWSGDYPWASIDAAREGYPGKPPERFDRRRLAALPKARPQTVPALHPETLALEFALAELVNSSPAYRAWLARHAWAANPNGIARSLWRLHRLALQDLLDEDEQAVFAELATAPADLAGLDNAAAMQAWEALQTSLQTEAEERKQQASQLAQIIHAHGEKGKLEPMAAKFAELRGMAEAWVGDMGVRTVFANRLECTASHYGECGQWALMEQALTELRDLSTTHPDEADIRLEWSKGLVNAASDYGKQGDWQAMAAGLAELRKLAQDHPDEAEVRLCWAWGLYNAAKYYGEQGELQAMAARLAELRELAQAHPGEAEVRLHWAMGLVNATSYYGEQGDLQAMAARLAELRELAQAHPDEVDVRLSWARGLHNAANDYGKQGDWQAMAARLAELRELAQAHPGEAEVRLHWAMGLVNATSYYGEQGDLQAMAARLAELRELALAHSDEAEVRLGWAGGLVNATRYYGIQGDMQAMAARLAELRELAQAHPAEEEIQLRLARGLHNQTIYDPANASAAISELKTLAQRYPVHDGIQHYAHQHGVSYAQQEIAKQEALERQVQALLAARHPR